MKSIKEKYKLTDNLTEDMLKDTGYKHGVYKESLYKDMILLLITIDLSDRWWTYQVCNSDTNTLYIPYYNRLTGKNELVSRLDKKIDKVFKNMVNQKIFER